MTLTDTLKYAFFSIERAPSRTLLMLLAMAIAVTSVIMLTALGEAARRYVINEFATLGTDLVFMLPGKSETASGTLNASFGGSTRPVTIEDAAALKRHPDIARVGPMVFGGASLSRSGLERETVTIGTTPEMLSIRQWHVAAGQFLNNRDWTKSSAICVIGKTIASELFGKESPIGKWLRIGDHRFRVIGVLADTGNEFGTRLEETVYIPIASAMSLFNTDNIFRVIIQSKSREAINRIIEFSTTTMKERHYGEEDVTFITQDAMLDTFNRIFSVLTMSVAGIAAISLAVAGILIMNVMLVAVSQRTSEVGLLKAVGAAPRVIVKLFLAEAALLSVFGAAIGTAAGLAGCWLISQSFPILDMKPPAWAILAGVGVAFITGVSFGILPARRAAALDPVTALATH